MKVDIKNFKKISHAQVELDKVNVFIGTNNSGKSSFIQAIQFAISSGQTLQIKGVGWVRGVERRLALDSTDFLYTPTRNVASLYHGKTLTSSKKSESRKYIEFTFKEGQDESKIQIAKGRNGGFTTIATGKRLGVKLSDMDNPYCVYVPGIAGIPVIEKYEVSIAIKKSATRGDSNNFLRNIILAIFNEQQSWDRFIESINNIYIDVKINVDFDPNTSEFIEVTVTNNGYTLPIDSIGTGLLQTIQVFAYIEYFKPTILLLDEPDAHIHPTKQKLLAAEIVRRTEQNSNLKVVFSTHSRYILDALEDKAKVFHFQDGKVYSDIKDSKILLDIGAADTDYLFSKKHLKYIIVTEDKVDNIVEKKAFLKKFALANGLTEDEFVLHSYEGCTKVDFAKILKGFVAKQIPGIEVIVHIDRDQKIDSDTEIVDLKISCERNDVKLFVTKFSEIENYFCQPSHISTIYTLSLEEATQIYQDALFELSERTRNKISNFILNYRRVLALNKDGSTDIVVVNQRATDWYDEYGEFLTPGKELLGKIKSHIQNNLKEDPQQILNVSDKLIDQNFQQLIAKDNITIPDLSSQRNVIKIAVPDNGDISPSSPLNSWT